MKSILILAILIAFVSPAQASYPRYKLEDIMSQGQGEMELVELNLGPIDWTEVNRKIDFNYKYADPKSPIYAESLLRYHFNLIHRYSYNIPYENGDIINFGDHTDPHPVFTIAYNPVYPQYYNSDQNCSVNVTVENYSVVVKIGPTLDENADLQEWWSEDNSHIGYRYNLDQVKKCAMVAQAEMQEDLKIFVVRSKKPIKPRDEDYH